MVVNLKRLFWVAVIGGLLCLAVMPRAGGRMGCVLSPYERFDFFESGVLKKLIRDGSPTLSIMTQALIPGSVKAYSAFYNVTDLLDCARDEKYADRISFVELRSAALTKAIERWRARHDAVSGFRSGNMWKDRVIVTFDTDRPRFRVWDPAYLQAAAPDWVPLAQLNEATLIAFWGDGHLFQGTEPDQYYWIGYR